jgi:hypothetical protein
MNLAHQQRQLQAQGRYDQLGYLEQSAIHSDDYALSAVGQAEQIGQTLVSEIHRVAIDRRTAFSSSMKTIASSMKEACSERLAIWESTLDALQLQPESESGQGQDANNNNSMEEHQHSTTATATGGGGGGDNTSSIQDTSTVLA